MESLLAPFVAIDLWQILRNLLYLGFAYLLALPLGWDRESERNSAGLRTFPLVAAGACAFMLTGISVLEDSEAHSRVMYGLITGIGFVGGGAIVKSDDRVHGTATAAGIWNTGAIGMAVAWSRFEIAITLCVVTFLTFAVLSRLKPHEGGSD